MPLDDRGKAFPSLTSWMRRFEARSVSPAEIEMIPVLLRQGWLEGELRRKLDALDPSNPEHASFTRLVEDALGLLAVVDRGEYEPGPGWPELARRLCRALAYVVKDGDAIPDHLPGGLADDRRELDDWAARAETELLRFEQWRRRG